MTQTPQISTRSEPDRIDLLIDQVGRLTEGLTEFRTVITESMTEFRTDLAEFRSSMEQSMTEFRTDLAEFRTAMEQSVNEFRADLDEIKLTTKQQAETAASQAETTAKLVANAESQQQSIEQLAAAVRLLVERG